MQGSQHRRTLVQLWVSVVIAGLMIAAFALVGGLGVGMAQGQGNGGSGHPNNHGATVSTVAQSSCSAANRNGVVNHGQCVSAVARGTTTQSVSGSSPTNGTAPTHHTKKTHTKKTHTKKTHTKKTHTKKTHTKKTHTKK